MTSRVSIIAALGAAALFGASTPIAKGLAEEISPVLLAGLGVESGYGPFGLSEIAVSAHPCSRPAIGCG
jgi:hypothetical protein